MMTEEEVSKLFAERGALLQGHFKLTSGLHSDSQPGMRSAAAVCL